MSAILKSVPIRWGYLFSEEDIRNRLEGKQMETELVLTPVKKPFTFTPPEPKPSIIHHFQRTGWAGYGGLRGGIYSVKDDEWGNTCQFHPNIKAVIRICSESDSFGSEYYNLCAVCNTQRLYDEERKRNDPDRWEQCRCGNREPHLITYRDPDEGMHGPVYEHCSKCHERMNDRIREELEYERQYADDDDYDGYDPGPDDDGMDDYEEPEPCPMEYPLVTGVIDVVAKCIQGFGLSCQPFPKYTALVSKVNPLTEEVKIERHEVCFSGLMLPYKTPKHREALIAKLLGGMYKRDLFTKPCVGKPTLLGGNCYLEGAVVDDKTERTLALDARKLGLNPSQFVSPEFFMYARDVKLVTGEEGMVFDCRAEVKKNYLILVLNEEH